MDENNNNAKSNLIDNDDQNLELKKLLDQYSNEVNKSQPELEPSLSSGFDTQIPEKSEAPLTPNFEPQLQPEQPPEMIPNQEPSLSSGFDSQIPPKTEEINNFENQIPRNDFVNEPIIEDTMPVQNGKKFNFFKFLFIISLVIFLGVLASIAYVFINSQKTEEIIETIIPTATPEITAVPTIENLLPTIEEIISPTATSTAVPTP